MLETAAGAAFPAFVPPGDAAHQGVPSGRLPRGPGSARSAPWPATRRPRYRATPTSVTSSW